MAMNRFELPPGNGWVEVVTTTTETNVIVENLTSVPVKMSLQGSQPSAGTNVYHTLNPNEKFHRETLNTSIWVRDNDDKATAVVIVSNE